MLDQPEFTRTLKTGYPNLVAQNEHAGICYYGNEILNGDEIVIDQDGEVVLKEDLEKYLQERYGFKFTQAE